MTHTDTKADESWKSHEPYECSLVDLSRTLHDGFESLDFQKEECYERQNAKIQAAIAFHAKVAEGWRRTPPLASLPRIRKGPDKITEAPDAS